MSICPNMDDFTIYHFKDDLNVILKIIKCNFQSQEYFISDNFVHSIDARALKSEKTWFSVLFVNVIDLFLL